MIMKEMLPSKQWPSPEQNALLNFWASDLEHADTRQILDWAFENFHPRLAMAVSSGLSCPVLVSLLRESPLQKEYAKIDMFCIDTGYHFPETLEYMDFLEKQFDMNIIRFSPKESVEEFESRFDMPPYQSYQNLCCQARKYEVFQEITSKYDAIICGARRDQSLARSGFPIVEWDERLGVVRIAPLARWTRRQLWTKIKRESIPYNKLYDYGFDRIECRPCTLPSFSDHDDPLVFERQ